MNRREILKSGILAAAGFSVLPALAGFNRTRNNIASKEHFSYLKLLIGDLETYILSDGIVALDSVQPIFAPAIDDSTLKSELRRLHSSSEHVQAGINVLLIRKDDKVILLDTGSGHHFGKNAGKLVPSLATLGLTTEDITDIVITHAHVDHIGGVLDENNHVIFQKATYHIARREYDFWMSDNPDFSNSKGDPANATKNISFVRNILTAIESKLELFEYGQELFSCLIPELAEGHTPGHTIFTIHSAGKIVKHIVDTFHLPLLVSKPEWGTQWDTNFDKAVSTRKRIMKEAAESGSLLMSCHLPWPGLGYMDKIGAEYYWNIYQYADPVKIII